MTKEIRDMSLTIGTIGLVTVLALFLCTLMTSLKLGKISLFICAASIGLILFGLSRQNRSRLRSIFTANGFF
ncbi:MAG: hypothetical protein COA74_08325 [Gammaproteobacteria bacterium]|nr:MAG: hypothetical protein COA74_08325 [Gammaproteobacteria bacterium]